MATTRTNETTSNNGSSPETDQDFDPTADMLIHDYDDEQTLEEEENMNGGECVAAELNELEKEGGMPIAQLLAMYGYSSQHGSTTTISNSSSSTSMSPRSSHEHDAYSSSEEEILSNHDLTLDKEEIARDLLSNSDENEYKETDVHALLSSVTSSQTAQLLQSESQSGGNEGSESEEDLDYQPQFEWKKTISVGSSFQSVVPEGLCKYGDAPAYENEDRLLWDPSKMEDSEVEKYLQEIHLQILQSAVGVQSIPTGAHIKDDEHALYLLLQCGHNKEEALRRRKMQAIPPTDPMSLWSEEECSNFEMGLHFYGKDFYLIHQHKVKTRSVGELVQFYYLWKKTERHDLFASKIRLEKRKYTMHPGVTDYLERFLDDQEMSLPQVPARDRSASPVHSLLFGDPKRSYLKPHCEHAIGDGLQAFQPILTYNNIHTETSTVPCNDVKLHNSVDTDKLFVLKCPPDEEYVPAFKKSELESVDNVSVPFDLNNSTIAGSSPDIYNHIDQIPVTSINKLSTDAVNVHNVMTVASGGVTAVDILV